MSTHDRAEARCGVPAVWDRSMTVPRTARATSSSSEAPPCSTAFTLRKIAGIGSISGTRRVPGSPVGGRFRSAGSGGEGIRFAAGFPNAGRRLRYAPVRGDAGAGATVSGTSDLTVIVPSYNRHSFLPRIAEVFGGSGLRAVIVDGSADAYPSPGALDGVEYRSRPGVSFNARILSVLTEVTHPVVALCADDDLLVPAAVGRCADVLVGDPSASTVGGHTLAFGFTDGTIELERIELEYEAGIGGATPVERVRAYLRNYVQLVYPVHRTENLRLALETAGDEIDGNLWEMLVGVVAMISGEHRHLHDLYSFRQRLSSSQAQLLPTLELSIYDDRRMDDLEPFLSRCANLLADEAGIGMDEARMELSDGLVDYAVSVWGPRGIARWKRRARAVLNRSGPVGSSIRRFRRSLLPPPRLCTDDAVQHGSPDISVLDMCDGELDALQSMVRAIRRHPGTE